MHSLLLIMLFGSRGIIGLRSPVQISDGIWRHLATSEGLVHAVSDSQFSSVSGSQLINMWLGLPEHSMDILKPWR